jgi:integrase
LGKRKSLIRQAIERLDSLMAIGQSRFVAKQEQCQQGTPRFAFSTGLIHSHRTRVVYQEQVLRFLNWCRAHHHLRYLEQVEPRVEELACAYLLEHLHEGKSVYTLLTERSALRLFFGERKLAEAVTLPKRRREEITRSRLPVASDRQFQPANWQGEIAFLEACGLRRSEAAALRVNEVIPQPDGKIYILVRRGKGGRQRIVPVLPGSEEAVLISIKDRSDPEGRVFARLPKRLDVHALRRTYAQRFYQHLSKRELPPTEGRLRPQDYDREAVRIVSQALGHRRLDVVLTYYLR